MRVSVVDYGAGNLRSVCAALERAGAEPRVTASPASVAEAPLAVIAGVGNAGTAARGLAARGLDEALRERAERSRPVLGICLGLQLLFDESEEGGPCLRLLPGRVGRLRARRVPHMGWNSLVVTPGSGFMDGLDGRDVYFAHSYDCRPAEPVAAAVVDHDGPVVAAIESGPLAGVQFHPERSGPAGAQVLRNVLAWSRSA